MQVEATYRRSLKALGSYNNSCKTKFMSIGKNKNVLVGVSIIMSGRWRSSKLEVQFSPTERKNSLKGCAEMLEDCEEYLLEGTAFLRIFHFCLGFLSVEFICSL